MDRVGEEERNYLKIFKQKHQSSETAPRKAGEPDLRDQDRFSKDFEEIGIREQIKWLKALALAEDSEFRAFIRASGPLDDFWKNLVNPESQGDFQFRVLYHYIFNRLQDHERIMYEDTYMEAWQDNPNLGPLSEEEFRQFISAIVEKVIGSQNGLIENVDFLPVLPTAMRDGILSKALEKSMDDAGFLGSDYFLLFDVLALKRVLPPYIAFEFSKDNSDIANFLFAPYVYAREGRLPYVGIKNFFKQFDDIFLKADMILAIGNALGERAFPFLPEYFKKREGSSEYNFYHENLDAFFLGALPALYAGIASGKDGRTEAPSLKSQELMIEKFINIESKIREKLNHYRVEIRNPELTDEERLKLEEDLAKSLKELAGKLSG